MTARLNREQSAGGQEMNGMRANMMDCLHGPVAWDGWNFEYGILGGLWLVSHSGCFGSFGALGVLLLAAYWCIPLVSSTILFCIKYRRLQVVFVVLYDIDESSFRVD